MNVDITICREGIEIPKYQTEGSVGFDFAAAEETIIQPKQIAIIPTGLIIKIPKGHMLMITARSSNATKKGIMLANGVGTIDQDYCGPNDEIHVMCYNFTDQPITIDKGHRIANGLFLPIERANWQLTQNTQESSRGGFGSTGQ